MRSAKEAVAYAKAIHSLIRYLGISDGNMAEGSMRCDCNVSLRKKGTEKFGTRREIKNVNSFKFIEKAINAEISWQMDELESGREIIQSTVLYDANKNETRAMRSKEEANDYRYFPDPDLLPVIVTETMINDIRALLPELPVAKKDRFMADFGLSAYDAGVLVAERELAEYFEATVKAANGQAKQAANWVMGELLGALNKAEKELTDSPISAEQLGGLINRINDNTISGKIAKQVFEALWNGEGDSADAIIDSKGLKQVTDTGAIEAVINEVIAASPQQLADYRGGKDKLFGYFVGEVMKRSKGKANPAQVNELLKKALAG
jgi:aspartyl-tRNA(Asn)/glutamyl-tRNA(Gln) amidotransferase subunit B